MVVSMFDIKITVVGGIPRIAVTGELVAGASCQALADVIDQLADLGEVDVMVDLSAMQRIDSGGLGALIQAHGRLSELGGTFVVLRPSARFRALLTRTRLSGLLVVADTEIEATDLAGRRTSLTWARPGRC